MSTSSPKECYVVLHIGTGPSANQDKLFPMIVRDSNKRFDLSDDFWIERLDEELAENIQKACEPAHHNTNIILHDRHLYAFVCRVPSNEKTRYEGLSELHAVVALSRLVNPTSTGDRYSAKVFDLNASNSIVQAIQFRGNPDVFLGANGRDWLSVDDGKTLQRLMPWISQSKPMHKRIHRAYWNHENAMRSYYLDIRWTLIASGFEALMNTGERRAAKQFRDRVRQLDDEFKIGLTDHELGVAYKLRSKLVHAQGFLSGMEKILPQTRHTDLYLRLEALLRETIKRSLLDEKFGNSFRNACAVNSRWSTSRKPQTLRSRLCRKLQSLCNLVT